MYNVAIIGCGIVGAAYEPSQSHQACPYIPVPAERTVVKKVYGMGAGFTACRVL